MFLLEQVIKLLASNSGTLFLGILVLIFGYYGWLLWNLSNQFQMFFHDWNKYSQGIKEIRENIQQLDKVIYSNLLENINQCNRSLNEISEVINSCDDKLEKYSEKIISEVKEESDEVKDTVKLIMSRSIKKARMNNDDNEKEKSDGE